MLSNELYALIEENLQKKRQTILFLNRRGYSTFIMCRNCGYTVKCKNCDISLTYHKYEKKLKCHYCGYEQELVSKCPECNSDKIRYFGTGTQKLEQEIQKQFPNASTIRMDVDTVTKKNSHENILNKFKNENINILIGTQMVVKGHHFPNVTLVGVIAADSSLNIDDYRANERTFQILTQVAGRAGREKLPGKVIIQTYNPDNFSIQCAKQQNYNKFYNTEILLREQLKYPPFCDIIVIGFSGISEAELQDIGKRTYIYLNQEIKELFDNGKLDKNNIKIFKPMPAPIDKIQNRFRYRIIIKAKMTEEINEILNKYLKKVYQKDTKSVRISIDVNPNNMS
jgi:primosomal protein N' (replication factor Y)